MTSTETPDEHVDEGPPSRAAYRRGCRCGGCRRENAGYLADWRARRRAVGMASSYVGPDAELPRGRTAEQDPAA